MYIFGSKAECQTFQCCSLGRLKFPFSLQNCKTYIYIPHGRQPATSSAQEMKTNYLSSQHGIVFLGFYFNDYSQAERLDILSKDAKVVIVDSKEMNKKKLPWTNFLLPSNDKLLHVLHIYRWLLWLVGIPAILPSLSKF